MTNKIVTHKACTKCGDVKALDMFHKEKRVRDGRMAKCKACQSASDAIHYAANSVVMLKACAIYRAANPEKRKAVCAAWSKANVKTEAVRTAAWRIANLDRKTASNDAWHKANPEKIRIYAQNRRALKVASGGTLSLGLSAKLFTLQRGKCPCCKQPLGDDYHLDHIIPVSRNGSNTDDNMQLLRSTCNLQKGAKHPVDFMQLRGFLI